MADAQPAATDIDDAAGQTVTKAARSDEETDDEKSNSQHVEEKKLSKGYIPHVQHLIQDKSLGKRHLPFSCTREYWKQYTSNDVKLRSFRVLCLFMIPFVGLVLMNSVSDGGQGSERHYIGEIVGACCFCMFTIYFLFLSWQMRSSIMKGDRYLFRIVTEFSEVENWTDMCVATTQTMYKFRPIQSISEFSAISGGQANHMIANLGPLIWVGITMMYLAEMQCTQYDVVLSYDDLLIAIGVCGIVMIGIYELNHYDLGMQAGHYTGVVMALCIPLGCLIRGYALGWTHMVVPIALNVLAWPAALLWFFKYLGEKASLSFEAKTEAGQEAGTWNEKEDDLKLMKEVNRFSLQCMFFEGFAIYCVTLSLSWYLVKFGKV